MSKINWSEDETFKLISIWRDFKLKLDQSSRNKKQLFLEMSSQLKRLGVDRSGSQIKVRITNLKYLYGRINKGKGGSPNSWVFYSAVHGILHDNPYYNKNLVQNFKRSEADESPPVPPVDVLLQVPEESSSECSSAESILCPDSAAVNACSTSKRQFPILRKLVNRSKRKREDNFDKVVKQGDELVKILDTLTAQSKRLCEQMEAGHKEALTEFKNIRVAFTDFLNCAKNSFCQQPVYLPKNGGQPVVYAVYQDKSDNPQ